MKAYYTAGVVYDILLTFGELEEEATEKRKYAKYKAAYIHNCLKNGETPIPGPPNEADDDSDVAAGGAAGNSGTNDENVPAPSNPPPAADEPEKSDDPPHSPIEFKPHPNPSEINRNFCSAFKPLAKVEK